MAAETRCFFEKALICGAGQCARAQRLDIGERIVCRCTSAAAAKICARYLALLRENAGFVFRQAGRRPATLSNSQEIRLQCGGLQGLADIAHGDEAVDSFDISMLLQRIEDQYPDIEAVPLDRIMPWIAAYEPRPHRKK